MQLQSRCQIKITEELSVLSYRLKYHDHTHKSLSTHNTTQHGKPTVQFDGSLYGGTTGRAEISKEKEVVKSRQNTTYDSKDLIGN